LFQLGAEILIQLRGILAYHHRLFIRLLPPSWTTNAGRTAWNALARPVSSRSSNPGNYKTAAALS
jgi:hypothetical protein